MDPSPSKRSLSPWMFSPAWDAVTLLSGISLCLLMVGLKPFGLDQRMMLVLIALERFVALTHSWSTTYLVTCSEMFRPLRKERRATFLTIPLLIFLCSLLLGVLVAKNALVADDGSLDRGGSLYYLYIGLYMVGHFWHFGRQDFGVLSTYRQKMKQTGKYDRNADRIYLQIMMYVIQPIMYVYVFSHFPFTNIVMSVIPVAWIRLLAAVAAVVAVVLFSGVFVFELSKPNRSAAKLIYYVATLFHPLFLFFSGAGLMAYWYLSYLWSHWLIATSLSARIHTRYHMSQGKNLLRSIAQHVGVIGAFTLAVWLLTRSLADFSLFSKDFVDARETLRTLPPGRVTLVGLFLGFLLGEQLVHYYCDRWLFRFQDPGVRKAVAPFFTDAA